MSGYASMILEIICSASEHLTAEEIYLHMKEQGSKAVLSTVYNNLARLLENGQIRRVCVEGFPDRYDRASRHDHLVCSVCGRLRDFCYQDLTDGLRDATGETILSYDLQVFYLCPECRNARETHGGNDADD